MGNGDVAAVVVTMVGFFLLLIWQVWWQPYLESKQPIESVPMLPNSHWLLGHLLWLLGKDYLEKQDALQHHADERGRCSCWIGPTQASLSLTSAQDAQALLRKHSTRHSAPILKHHFEMLAGKRNLLLLNGKEWKYYQSSLKAALTSQLQQRQHELQQIVINTTQSLVQNLQTKIKNSYSGTIVSNIDEFMKMITQDVFGKAAFSHDFGCCSSLELSKFATAFEAVEDDILNRCLHQPLLPQNLFYWIPTQRNRNFLQNRQYLRCFLRSIVQDRVKEKDTNCQQDILQKLISAHAQQEDALEDLVDILLSVLLAGYDTVSIALTYAVFLVSRHAEWEAKVLEEVQQIDWKAPQCLLCRAVVMEALRLYPVATALSRTLEKPWELSPTHVPRGCHVGISVWSIHRTEQHFPKPLEFRPDRWVKQRDGEWVERKKADNSSTIPMGNREAFLAFSAGGRSCPGQSFALEEASLALAILLRGLKIEVDNNYKVEMEWKVIVQKPKGGIPAKIFLR